MTIPRECKRLAEVDFPIAVVSKHAVREKSIRHGHPSTLHLWWARRPLASCRAMLLALLLPDPCDRHCPLEFKALAREQLAKVQGPPGPTDEDLRTGLLKFIGDFANWDLAAHPRYLEVSRGLVHAAHPEGSPLVVDPFAGGGSIPLEALRLGCDAFASDLNPVASLILKVLLEDIPRFGDKLAVELNRVGNDIRNEAERELAEFYPTDSDGANPIAYLWARTIRCESPGCGAEIPLVHSFWLSRRASRKVALRHRVERPVGAAPRVVFEIFKPDLDSDVEGGTVNQAKATCLCCRGENKLSSPLEPARVRAQLTEQRGGADVLFDRGGQRIGGALLLAVVTQRKGDTGRRYRLPNEGDYRAVRGALNRIEGVRSNVDEDISAVPNEVIPLTEIRRISVPLYGCTTWDTLFTGRQKLALSTLARKVRDRTHSGAAIDAALNRLLALSVSKQAERLSSFTSWITQTDAPRGTFARQALGFVWDFCELVPIVDHQEFPQLLDAMQLVVKRLLSLPRAGQVECLDACSPVIPDRSVDVWFTDPPYYDSVPYAHLADFFYVWLRRATHELSGWMTEPLTPKDEECVVDRPHRLSTSRKDRHFFEGKMAEAMAAGRRLLLDDAIGAVVFAHKTTEGWEALIGGMLQAGLTVTASWPIQTERGARLNAQDHAALAASVHLVCRPRSDDAPIGDWADVLHELPKRVGTWMERLQAEGVRGADLVFACIGPALEIYSRHSKVVDAEDREIPLGGDPEATDPYQRGYLAYVWETVGRAALQQVLGRDEGAGVLEEDARLVALFLWTLQSTNGASNADHDEEETEEDDSAGDEDDDEYSPGRKPKGYTLIFDVARRFAQPLGIHLDDWEGRVIETKKGVVRLLPVAERAKQLFGEDGAQAAADRIEREPASAQLSFFPEVESKPRRGRRKVTITASDESISQNRNATTLDRLHVAMLLQSSGRANALRALLAAEQERGAEFLRLANALSALYPRESEEKRLLDAMLLAVPK